jgi:hypothetical protein
MRPARLPTLGIFLAAVTAVTGSPVVRQQPAHDWENPAVVERNKEPAHAT